ncbi:hypothetical protein BGZ52_010400 [Haplosporangium bisporale]|nr:hypothetical protein BGZ52_010400 [Haplosporangium bisporale]
MTSSFSDATNISLLQDPITPPSKVSEAVTSATPTVVLSSTEVTTLPTPPSSSSSRLITITAEDQDQDDQDQEPPVTATTHNAKRYSITEEAMTRPAEPQHDPSKTHSATSSTSSIALPASITNKHVSLAKTKSLGHLTRSTSSEVDSEVANALASGRSIVSKTDWKEEDAQYLVQLIEKQFPKGNIIWDWVGQQMTSKGFTKNQCRSKWKRIRTKILHSGEASGKDRDLRGSREQELDELIDDEEDINDTPSRDDSGLGMGRPSAYSPGRGSDRGYYNGNSDNFRDNEDYGSPPQARHRTTDPYHNRPSSSWESRRRTDDYPREEYWSDNDESRYPPSRNGGYGEHTRRTSTSSRHYGDRGRERERERERERYQSSWSPSENRRRPSSVGYDEDDGPSLSTIVATPNSFGKIEWKPEDSDYLVRLIETKFAARKVDWAWVATKMESRGYDRTQCKSRWWRVQHRQNQANNQGGKNKRMEQPIDELQDDGEDVDVPKADEHFSESPLVNKPDTTYEDREHMSSSPSPAPEYIKENTTPRDKTKNGSENESPRARGQEHQKHIEWKEEDSLFMYRMIEKEFPVGNVVWSVIGEKMASRGYSQTQCMSKWRRHLKNCKLTGESVLPNKQESVDMDMMDTAETGLVDENNRSSSRYRDVGYEDDVTEGAAKRVKTGDYHSRYIIAPELGNIPLDPKLVEEEYDRYYDKGGKRKAVDDDPSSESRVRYLSEALSHNSPPAQAYSPYDEKRHRDEVDHVEHRSKRREVSGSSESRRYAQDWDPYYDERDPRRARHVSEDRNDHPSPSRDDYAHDKDRSEHRHREPSNGRPHRAEAPRSSSSHPQDDYPRRDSESRGGVREREYQYKPRSLEYRPRGSDYEYRPRSDYEYRPRDTEYRPRGSEYRPRGSEYRPRSDYEYKPRSSRTSHSHSHSQERERHRSYTEPESHDYDHREQRERERDRNRDRERDHEFGDLDLLGDDEEMDWEAGRWAGRDMARLTAAVARQGRRWDMLREQIRMPTLVPYFEEEEDIYEGMFDAPPPVRTSSSSHRSYGNNAYDEPMREKHHHHHHHQHHQHHRQVSQQFRSTYPSSSSKGSIKQTNTSSSKAVSYSSLPKRSRGEDAPVAARSRKASYSSLPQQQQRAEHVAREELEDHGMGLEPVPMVLPVEGEEEAREEDAPEEQEVVEEMESAPVENIIDEGVAVETAGQESEEAQEEEEEGPMVVDEVDAAGTAVVANATTTEEEEEKEEEVEPLNP